MGEIVVGSEDSDVHAWRISAEVDPRLRDSRGLACRTEDFVMHGSGDGATVATITATI